MNSTETQPQQWPLGTVPLVGFSGYETIVQAFGDHPWPKRTLGDTFPHAGEHKKKRV